MKLRTDTPTATTSFDVQGLDGLATLSFMFSEGQLVRTQHDRPDGDDIDVAAICEGDSNEPHVARRVIREAITDQEPDLTRRQCESLADWALEALAAECADEDYVGFFGVLGIACTVKNAAREVCAKASIEADTAALADAAPALLAALRELHGACGASRVFHVGDLAERNRLIDAYNVAGRLLAGSPAPRWEVALNGENVWSEYDASRPSAAIPTTFATEAEAEKALAEYFTDCREAFERGDMSDDGTEEGFDVRQVR